MRSFSLAAICAALTLSAVAGCSDSTNPDTNDNGTNPPALTAEYYVQAKINGTYETQQLQDGPTVYISPGYEGSRGGSNSGGYIVAQRSFFSRITYGSGGIPELDPTYRSIGILGIRNYPSQPPTSQYNLLFRQGSMPFGNYENEVDGVEIRWRDAAGTNWATGFGSGDQTGSSFTVTSYTPITVAGGQSVSAHYKVIGTFSATLYDSNGNSMPITDGKFCVPAVFY